MKYKNIHLMVKNNELSKKKLKYDIFPPNPIKNTRVVL